MSGQGTTREVITGILAERFDNGSDVIEATNEIMDLIDQSERQMKLAYRRLAEAYARATEKPNVPFYGADRDN